MFLQILLISIVLVALAFAGFAIKILTQKNGEFKKSCGSTDPTTGQKIGCTCGDDGSGEKCENKLKKAAQPS